MVSVASSGVEEGAPTRPSSVLSSGDEGDGDYDMQKHRALIKQLKNQKKFKKKGAVLKKPAAATKTFGVCAEPEAVCRAGPRECPSDQADVAG